MMHQKLLLEQRPVKRRMMQLLLYKHKTPDASDKDKADATDAAVGIRHRR